MSLVVFVHPDTADKYEFREELMGAKIRRNSYVPPGKIYVMDDSYIILGPEEVK